MSKEQQGILIYSSYGREFATFDGSPGFTPWMHFEDGAKVYETTPEKLQAAYEYGKQQAEQEKQQSPVGFYLCALLSMMENPGEWYGSDFDGPKWLVGQALYWYRKEKGEL